MVNATTIDRKYGKRYQSMANARLSDIAKYMGKW